MFQAAALAMALAKGLGASKPRAPAREPETHDYSRPRWGHACNTLRVIEEGQHLRVSGFGHGVSAGDYLILPNDGETTRYRVDTIRYQDDPRDMWFADLTFAPRSTEA
ncbi:hypothetical protein GOFOIKOB_0386 [Methylobacterium tardum]|uniref:Uncharacterized protein n=1 Tax=Methylobacterium tardum TaxID=374432 RepID=A0AA37WUM9_9HYPH|nr:hypothetical protein [Methylobacterium tardum]URD36920.1 hypothetical protein M6G65_32285 [Methylobacterium tardum]GJE47364.1 hypothetical protein GOFOIKOB_0386 [Methylobacterium tardum]GLS71263.1 hypothetical protein GCM10007890_32760 [Methylobacterium tardum]